MSIIRTACLAAFLSVALVAEASALSFEDITGLWCGLTTNYVFAPNSLTVNFHNGAPSKRFKVNRYEYLPHTIKMHWEDKGETFFTDFSEFGADGQTMAQQKSKAGPRRPYKRCK